MHRRTLLSIASAALLLVATAVSPAYAATTTTSHSISVLCTGGGQVCDPPFTVTATTAGVLQAEYVTPGHCSDMRVTFAVDSVVQYTSPFLGAFASTGVVDLGPVTPGTHTVSVQAEGTTGGCNTGSLAAWEGTLLVTTSDCDKPGNGYGDKNHTHCGPPGKNK